MIKGFDRFFVGVVEDRMDPALLGRVRVRVFGLHPKTRVKSEISGIATSELLWMNVLQPIYSAAMSGIGQSPTGVVEGTHVFGIFRDEYFQDGLVLGTYAGIYQNQPDINYGFSDPSGQYPRYVGNDVNILARGGKESSVTPPGKVETHISVEEQDLNRDIAVKPDETPKEDIKPDPNPDFTLEEMLRGDEGIRIAVYWDSEGYPTIGIGHLIVHEKTKNSSKINNLLTSQVGRKVTNGRITEAEVSKLFADDVANVRRDISRNAIVGPVYSSLDNTRKMAIENMCFQMGVGGVAKFKAALAAMFIEKWDIAYKELLDSVWASQTPGRANRVSKIILNGNLASYGVKSSGRLRAAKTQDVLFEEPASSYGVKSSGRLRAAKTQDVLFEEPASSYGAVYPYNQVYESESGHIQEFDDTPGHERYHRKHPVGTFEEIQPDGTRVVKIVGDDYLIVKNDRNLHVSGRLNLVVDGDVTQYVMGNVKQNVDGDVTQFIRGSSTQTIEGNQTSLIKGNSDSVIKGDSTTLVEGNQTSTINGNLTATVKTNADIAVNGNCSTKVDGDYKLEVGGNYTSSIGGQRTDNVSGNWNRSASEVSDTASGQFSIDGSRINLG